MKIFSDPRDEFRIVAIALIASWTLAGLLILFSWPIPALSCIFLGSAAAGERLFRIATQASSAITRAIAVFIGAAILALMLGSSYLFNPALVQAGGH